MKPLSLLRLSVILFAIGLGVLATNPAGNALPFGHGGGTATAPPPSNALTTLLSGMASGSWQNVVGTTWSSANYLNNTGTSDYNATTAGQLNSATNPQDGLFMAWSGGELDTLRHRVMMWGGAHINNFDNGIYAFDLPSLTQMRLTTPSSFTGFTCGGANGYKQPDNTPFNIHTYEAMAYDPVNDKINILGPGASTFFGSCSAASAYAVAYEMRLANTPQTVPAGAAGGNAVAGSTVWQFITPTSGTLIADVAGLISIYNTIDHCVYRVWDNFTTFKGVKYCPSTGAVTQPVIYLTDYHEVGVFVPTLGSNGYIVSFSSASVLAGKLELNNLDGTQSSNTEQATTGDQTCQNYAGPQGQAAPGLVYRADLDRLICMMPGSKTLYSLNPQTWVWSVITMTGDTPAAEAGNSNGIYRRFGYDATFNAYYAMGAYNALAAIGKP